MILPKDTINIPKIIFPLISNKDQLRKILNVNQCDNFNEPLVYKLKLAVKIFFNRYIYYHLKDTIPHKREIFHCACKHGNMKIIHLMIEKIESTLYTSPPIIRDEKVIDYWNIGLKIACREGHLPIVDLMIGKGATDFYWGLMNACCQDNLLIVNLMIEKIENIGDSLSTLSSDSRDKNGANWYLGLHNACVSNHLSIVKLMVEKIESSLSTLPAVSQDEIRANYLDEMLRIANNKKHLEIANYLSKLFKKLKVNYTDINI